MPDEGGRSSLQSGTQTVSCTDQVSHAELSAAPEPFHTLSVSIVESLGNLTNLRELYFLQKN